MRSMMRATEDVSNACLERWIQHNPCRLLNANVVSLSTAFEWKDVKSRDERTDFLLVGQWHHAYNVRIHVYPNRNIVFAAQCAHRRTAWRTRERSGYHSHPLRSQTGILTGNSSQSPALKLALMSFLPQPSGVFHPDPHNWYPSG